MLLRSMLLTKEEIMPRYASMQIETSVPLFFPAFAFILILQRACQRIEDSIENDNPWDLSDPKAYYNKYRAKADEYLKERDEMYRKANEAFKRQQRSVAAYYAKLVCFLIRC